MVQASRLDPKFRNRPNSQFQDRVHAILESEVLIAHELDNGMGPCSMSPTFKRSLKNPSLHHKTLFPKVQAWNLPTIAKLDQTLTKTAGSPGISKLP